MIRRDSPFVSPVPSLYLRYLFVRVAYQRMV